MVFLKSDLSIVELVKCANVRQCEYDHKWMNTSMIPVSHKLPVVLIFFSYSRLPIAIPREPITSRPLYTLY